MKEFQISFNPFQSQALIFWQMAKIVYRTSIPNRRTFGPIRMGSLESHSDWSTSLKNGLKWVFSLFLTLQSYAWDRKG